MSGWSGEPDIDLTFHTENPDIWGVGRRHCNTSHNPHNSLWAIPMKSGPRVSGDSPAVANCNSTISPPRGQVPFRQTGVPEKGSRPHRRGRGFGCLRARAAALRKLPHLNLLMPGDPCTTQRVARRTYISGKPTYTLMWIARTLARLSGVIETTI
jgi:hypothetical protein